MGRKKSARDEAVSVPVNAVNVKRRSTSRQKTAERVSFQCPNCAEGVKATCPVCGGSRHRHHPGTVTVQCIERDCGRFYIPQKILEDELQRRKNGMNSFGLSPDVRRSAVEDAGECIHSPAGRPQGECIHSRVRGQVLLISGSWRVNCKECGGDISEPLDKRTAKRFLNEHIKNKRHIDAKLIREGLPLARA